MIDDSNLLSTNIGQNFQNDINIKKLQSNLIRMGFDLLMINKIIFYFKIKTEDEALDYLVKTDDGMWNHPFIPKEINSDENNGLLEQPKAMVNNVLTRINSFGFRNSLSQKTSGMMMSNDSIEIKVENDICEICGESKEIHNIKEFISPNRNNINNEENNFISSNENENNNILKYNEETDNLIVKDNIITTNLNEEKIQNKVEEKEEDNPNECQICMGDLENPVEIEKCKHKFCRECLNSYLVNLINLNRIDKIPCPNNKCSNQELSEGFFSEFLSEQEYFKFRQFKAQNEIARDSKKIFCPLCDSYAKIDGMEEDYDSNNPNYKKTILKCQKGHEFCSCGRPIHENDCYHDDKEFKEFLTKEKIKKCPKCGFLIKKSRGCNHMTCGNPICKYEFCWLCMQEAVPNHFDYGPCAGKQFINPDSFMSKLQQSHPFLYTIFSFFNCIFNFIFLLVGIFVIPGISLTMIAYEIIIEGNALSNSLKKRYLRYLYFLTIVFISFSLESIVYILWGIVFAGLGILISLSIISIILSILKTILKCLCCCYDEKSEQNIGNNIEPNPMELGNELIANNDNNLEKSS